MHSSRCCFDTKMITVSIARVMELPCYASSGLFEELHSADVDSEIAVPEMYYTENMAPTSSATMDHLLLAASYWHFKTLPALALLYLWAHGHVGTYSLPTCYMAQDLRDDLGPLISGDELPHHWAIRHDQFNLLQELVAAAETPAAFGVEQWPRVFLPITLSALPIREEINTPATQLILAAKYGAAGCFDTLLKQNGADCETSRRCAEMICERDHVAMLRAMWSSGTLEQLNSNARESIACCCAIYNSPACMRFLTECFVEAFTKNDWVSWNAAAHGNMSCLQIAHASACAARAPGVLPYSWPHDQKYMLQLKNVSSTFGSVCYAAARCGHMECLQFALHHKYPCGPYLYHGAAEGGHVEIIQFLHEVAKVNWDFSATRVCANAQTLKYLLANGCPYEESALPVEYASRGQLDCLRVVVPLSNGSTDYAAAAAAANSSLDCLRFLLEETNCHVAEHIMQAAARACSLECIQYLLSRGCNWCKDICLLLAREGHTGIQCLRFAVENGAPVSPAVSLICAYHGRTECLRFLHAHGKPLSPRACEHACRIGDIALLRLLHELGCAWDEHSLTVAFDRGHIECMQFLLEKDCPAPRDGLRCNSRCGLHHAASIPHLLRTGRADLLAENVLSCAAGRGHTKCMQALLDVETSPAAAAAPPAAMAKCAVQAARWGRADVLHMLYTDYNCPVEINAAEAACRHGHGAALDEIFTAAAVRKEAAAVFSPALTLLATRSGSVPCMLICAANNCGVPPGVFVAAVDSGVLSTVKAAKDIGGICTSQCSLRAVVRRNQAMLHYLHTQCMCPSDGRACALAAERGDLDMLRECFNLKLTWDERTMDAAARAGSIHCLAFAHQNGCPFSVHAVIRNAARSGSIDALKYANEMCAKSKVEVDDILAIAARSGSVECMEYVLDRCGGRFTCAVCANAALLNNPSCLRFAREKGCPWDSETVENAALSRVTLSCLYFALENDCPISSQAVAFAHLAKNYSAQRALRKHKNKTLPYSSRFDTSYRLEFRKRWNKLFKQ